MIQAIMRTAQLFGQVGHGMIFHVLDIHMDLFVKLVSMLMPPEYDDQISQCPRGCSINKNLFQN